MTRITTLTPDRLLPSLPAALLAGRDAGLLEPLRLLEPGDLAATAAPEIDREPLAEALATANSGFGHPEAAARAELLADPATRVVVTGQQPGLFGGPLYTLYKALAASRLAARLEEEGTPAVAVFWIATEDHDFREVARAVFLGSDGPLDLSLGDDTAPLMPVGMRTLGEPVRDCTEALAAAFPGERAARWLDELSSWYRPDVRFGEAFARLLAGLLGERCPLLLDSMAPALKRLQAPLLRRLVERRQEVADALATAERAIGEAGFELQVNPQPQAAPLFALADGERRRIEWEADGFRLRGAEDGIRPLGRLLETIEENPGAISPGVQSRSLVQDAVLGTSVQIVGPGELAYLPQVAPLYGLLDVAAPHVMLRPMAAVLESRQRQWAEELELPWGRLVAAEFDADRFLAERSDGDPVAAVGREIERTLERLRQPLIELDPNLERPFEKTGRQIGGALDTLAEKARAAMARQDEIAAGRVATLRQTVRPLGAPQERVLSAAHFPAKYRDRFVELLWTDLELEPGLQLISVE